MVAWSNKGKGFGEGKGDDSFAFRETGKWNAGYDAWGKGGGMGGNGNGKFFGAPAKAKCKPAYWGDGISWSDNGKNNNETGGDEGQDDFKWRPRFVNHYSLVNSSIRPWLDSAQHSSINAWVGKGKAPQIGVRCLFNVWVHLKACCVKHSCIHISIDVFVCN